MAISPQRVVYQHGNFAIDCCKGAREVKLNAVLRKIRRDRNLSQENLADEIGVDYTTYNRYEKDSSKIQVETLEKIAKVYNISLRELINYTGDDKVMIEKEHDLKAYQTLVANLAPKFITEDPTEANKKHLYKMAFDLLEESKGYFLQEVEEYYSTHKKKKA